MRAAADVDALGVGMRAAPALAALDDCPPEPDAPEHAAERPVAAVALGWLPLDVRNEPARVTVHCSMSRAIVMRGYGPPEVLRLEQVELPALAAGEIRVRSLASPINHSDLEIRAGNWPILREPPFPYVPGLEVVGEVVEAGGEVDLPIGARVMTMMQGLGGIRAQRDGGYAEHVTLSAESVAQIPDGLDPLEVGALGLAAVTAYLGLSRLGSFAGKRVLVTGAAGGVGSAAVSLARAQGADVIGVVSRAEQVEYVRSLGASEVVVSKEQSVDDAFERRSVDRILDTVAGELFPQLIRTLRPGGGLSLVGAVGGGDVQFDGWALLLPTTITGYFVGDAGRSLAANRRHRDLRRPGERRSHSAGANRVSARRGGTGTPTACGSRTRGPCDPRPRRPLASRPAPAESHTGEVKRRAALVVLATVIATSCGNQDQEPRLLALPTRAGGGDALGRGLALIELLHVATGAAAGALLGSRRQAAVAGPLLHALLDVVPHKDIESRRFEISSTFVLLVLFAARRGSVDLTASSSIPCRPVALSVGDRRRSTDHDPCFRAAVREPNRCASPGFDRRSPSR